MNTISKSCIGEKCFCGDSAAHKIEETIFDDTTPRHPLTRYLCDMHFKQIMCSKGGLMIAEPPLDPQNGMMSKAQIDGLVNTLAKIMMSSDCGVIIFATSMNVRGAIMTAYGRLEETMAMIAATAVRDKTKSVDILHMVNSVREGLAETQRQILKR